MVGDRDCEEGGVGVGVDERTADRCRGLVNEADDEVQSLGSGMKLKVQEGKKLGSLAREERKKKGNEAEAATSCYVADIGLGRGGHKKGESVMDGGAKIIMGPLTPASQQKRLKRSRGVLWGGGVGQEHSPPSTQLSPPLRKIRPSIPPVQQCVPAASSRNQKKRDVSC